MKSREPAVGPRDSWHHQAPVCMLPTRGMDCQLLISHSL